MSNLAQAMFDLIDARTALNEAQDSVPDYLGPNSPEDFYGDELTAFEQADFKFQQAVTEHIEEDP